VLVYEALSCECMRPARLRSSLTTPTLLNSYKFSTLLVSTLLLSFLLLSHTYYLLTMYFLCPYYLLAYCVLTYYVLTIYLLFAAGLRGCADGRQRVDARRGHYGCLSLRLEHSTDKQHTDNDTKGQTRQRVCVCVQCVCVRTCVCVCVCTVPPLDFLSFFLEIGTKKLNRTVER